MEPRTDRANMKDWLEASPDIHIAAYIESYIPTLNVREEPFIYQNFYEILREVSVSYLNQDFELYKEFRAWDELSDEALMTFERELT